MIRHALPLRDFNATAGADPGLDEGGVAQAKRVPDAIGHHKITRIVTSPQLRSVQTASITADALDFGLDVDPDLAEYDRDFSIYIPIEDAKVEFKEAYDRIKSGELPEQVDAAAFTARVIASVDALAASAGHEDTVVAFTHGGVVNTYLQHVLGLAKPLTFPIDYCSVTRILFSRNGKRTVAAVNETAHVWDLLPRNARR